MWLFSRHFENQKHSAARAKGECSNAFIREPQHFIATRIKCIWIKPALDSKQLNVIEGQRVNATRFREIRMGKAGTEEAVNSMNALYEGGHVYALWLQEQMDVTPLTLWREVLPFGPWIQNQTVSGRKWKRMSDWDTLPWSQRKVTIKPDTRWTCYGTQRPCVFLEFRNAFCYVLFAVAYTHIQAQSSRKIKTMDMMLGKQTKTHLKMPP